MTVGGHTHSPPYRAVLAAFQTVLSLEAHDLSLCPEILWQQLYNRLQWGKETLRWVLAPEYARRTAPGAPSWILSRTRQRESAALVRTIRGHTGVVEGLAVTPDGRSIVAASSNGTVRAWHVNTGREQRVLAREDHSLTAFDMAPDGSFFVVAASDGTIRVRDTDTGHLRAVLEGHSGRVANCSVSPNGSLVASAGHDGTVRVWDVAAGHELAVLTSHRGSVEACAWSPDGSRIVTGGVDRTIRVWDTTSFQEAAALTGYRGVPRACAVGPDGSFAVTPCARGGLAALEVWEMATGKPRGRGRPSRQSSRGRVRGHTSACVVSSDGSAVVTTCNLGSVTVWDASSAREIVTLDGHAGGVVACAMAPDGSWCVSGGYDGTLMIWDLEAARAAARIERAMCHGGPVDACVWSPDGSFFVSASRDGTLRTWDGRSGQHRALLVHEQGVTACAVAPDGSWIASGGSDRKVRLWDVATGRPLATLEGLGATVTSCAVSPDGSFLVAAGRTRKLKVWDLAARRERATLVPRRGGDAPGAGGHAQDPRRSGFVNDCAVAPDASFVAAASHDGTVRLWDASTWREYRTFTSHSRRAEAYTGLSTLPIHVCAVAPDCSFIVSVGEDATLRIWDPATGLELAILEGDPGICAVSPDGTFVVTAERSDRLILADPRSGRAASARHRAPGAEFRFDLELGVWGLALRMLEGRVPFGRACAVSPDGALICAASLRDLHVWEADSGRRRATIAFPDRVVCAAFCPTVPLLAVGDDGGQVHLLDPLCRYGPLIVTPTDFGDGPAVRCPGCLERHPLHQTWFGAVVDCPRPGCGTSLRVNPFVAGGARTLTVPGGATPPGARP